MILKIVLGPSSHAADESADLSRAWATFKNWTSACLPLQTRLPLWTRWTLQQQLEPSSTIYSQVSIFSIYDSSGLFFFWKKRGVPALAVHPRFHRSPPVFLEKRLNLKSLKRQTNAEEEGTRSPFLLSLRLPLKAL